MVEKELNFTVYAPILAPTIMNLIIDHPEN